MTFGLLALTVAALFAGAAFYVSFVEHPARAVLDDASQLAEWKPSYERGTLMQGSLAIAGFVLGAAAWLTTGDLRWLAGALVLVANWPYTLLVIMPTNRALTAMANDRSDGASRALLERWARLHAVRTALGIAATMLFAWAAIG